MIRDRRGIALAIILTVTLAGAAPASARFARALPSSSQTGQATVTRDRSVATSTGGFRWTDAGIGAGTVVVLAALLVGTAAAVSRTRRRPLQAAWGGSDSSGSPLT
jgi:hypothetical protein